MIKYVTLNGDVYVKIEKSTARLVLEVLVAKCMRLYVSTYRFILSI